MAHTSTGSISLARQIARDALAVDLGRFDREVVAKAKLCLLDFLSCAFEAIPHPWSQQAIALARPCDAGASIVGTEHRATPGMRHLPTACWVMVWCARTCTRQALPIMAS